MGSLRNGYEGVGRYRNFHKACKGIQTGNNWWKEVAQMVCKELKLCSHHFVFFFNIIIIP